MCGIAGIVAANGSEVDKSLLERMTRTLAHRGPDAEGFFVHENVGLGHRRLSIIDLSSGQQPLFNEDGIRGGCLQRRDLQLHGDQGRA